MESAKIRCRRGGAVSRLPFGAGAGQLASVVNLNGAGRYIHFGVVQISLANLIVIAVMIVLLLAAIVIPFPKHETRRK